MLMYHLSIGYATEHIFVLSFQYQDAVAIFPVEPN